MPLQGIMAIKIKKLPDDDIKNGLHYFRIQNSCVPRSRRR